MATRRDFYTNPYNSNDFEVLPKVQTPQPHNPATFKVGSLDVYRRPYWTAGSVKTSDINIMTQINKITVHHTTVLPVYRNKSNAEIVKSIFNFHRHNKGWADIGYHYLIGSDGTVYQGRQEKFQGAHAGASNNKYNLGIALIGDFTQQRPSSRQLEALESLISEKVRINNISPNNIYGHKDLKATECPGPYLYMELQEIKRRLAHPLLSYIQ
jgi:N-acetyl-anhydromuramyl-L-alanine amidase AmpD